MGAIIAAVVNTMSPQKWRYSNVIQMVGTLGQPAADTVDATELCRLMAHRIGGTYRRLPVPLVLDNARTAEAMRHEEAVVTSFELAAWGDHKVPALRAALRTRLFTTLVTDEPTARQLLDT